MGKILHIINFFYRYIQIISNENHVHSNKNFILIIPQNLKLTHIFITFFHVKRKMQKYYFSNSKTKNYDIKTIFTI